MTTIVLLHSEYDKAHLAQVTAQMRELGPPTIKAFYDHGNGIWIALEGCHRLRAAESLGLMPEIEEIEVEDMGQVINEVFPGMLEDDYTFEQLLNCGCNPKMIDFNEE